MCLYVQPNRRNIYRAGYDILVYKRLVRLWGLGHYKLASPYQCKEYRLGKAYKHRRKLQTQSSGASVSEGLHSYYKPSRVDKNHYGHQFYPAIIPKGSLFIIGEYGEVVSNTLIVYAPGHFDGKPKGVGDFSQHTVVEKL